MNGLDWVEESTIFFEMFQENLNCLFYNENKVFLSENMFEVKPYINRESKSLELII